MVQAEDLTKLSEPEVSCKHEKQTLLSKYNIPVQHLEFEYIEKCQNARELEKIIKILRSGEEGHFPDLLLYTEKRLAQVKPNSKYLQKVSPVLSKTQLEKEEWNIISKDLTNWMDDVNQRDKELEQRKLKGISSTNTEVRKAHDVLTQPSVKTQPKRISSTDYESWNKYDPDTEILKMDLEEEKLVKQSVNAQKKQSTNAKSVSFNYIFSTEAEAKFQATCEKERGNECFKAGEYNSALEHYTNSLKCKPLVASYTNRALIYNKLKMYLKAVTDCKAALKIEPGNIKAHIRMAEAYDALKEYEKALASVESVIELDPNNTFAQQLANRIRPKVSKGIGCNKRYIIEDLDSKPPKTILKGTGNFKSTTKTAKFPKEKNKREVEKRTYEIIPIPGSSTMLPPYYIIIYSSDPEVIKTEQRRILSRPHLLHLTSIDLDSDEESERNHVEVEDNKKTYMGDYGNNNNKIENVKTKDLRKLKIKPKSATKSIAQGDQRKKEGNINEIPETSKQRKQEEEKEGGGDDSHNKTGDGVTRTIEELQSPFTFIETWNSIRKDSTFKQHAEVLRKLDFNRINEVIGYKLDDEMLSSFINCLHKHFMVPGELDRIRSILINITRIPRFKMITLFLKESDWKHINQLIEFLNQHGRNLPSDVKLLYSTK